MIYKPQAGDSVRVFVRNPFKEHVCSPMVVTDVHYNSKSLHYINAIDENGDAYELMNKLFEIRLLKKKSVSDNG